MANTGEHIYGGTGANVIAAIGDFVDGGGSQQSVLLVRGGGLTMLDWLMAIFTPPNATNVHEAVDEVFAYPWAADFFDCP